MKKVHILEKIHAKALCNMPVFIQDNYISLGAFKVLDRFQSLLADSCYCQKCPAKVRKEAS